MSKQFKELFDSLNEAEKLHLHEYVGWLKGRAGTPQTEATDPPPPPPPGGDRPPNPHP